MKPAQRYRRLLLHAESPADCPPSTVLLLAYAAGESAELMELGPDPQPRARPSALDFLPEPSAGELAADAQPLTLVNGITDDDSEEDDDDEMDEDSEEVSDDDDDDSDEDDEGSVPIGERPTSPAIIGVLDSFVRSGSS